MENEFNKKLMESSGIGKKLETAYYSHLTIVGKDNGKIQLGFDEGSRYIIGTYDPEKIVFDDEGRILEAKSLETLIVVENIDNRYKEACDNPVNFYDEYLNKN
jgi:hypothetical protein